MKKYIIIAALSAVLSAAAVSSFFLWGGGVNVTNNYHQEQFQNQSQAQLILGMYAVKGKVNWECSKCRDIVEKYGAYGNYLNTLPPEQSLFSKDGGSIDGTICIPVIQDK